MSNKPNFLVKNYPLRLSDFDKNNRILPSSILDIFQDIAGQHATILGISGIDLLQSSRCWMLTRIRYEILRQPKLYETLSVKTWPVESKRIELDRDYLISDAEGNVIIKGSSQWVVMDISDRSSPKLVPARDFEMNLSEYITERIFERAFGRAVYNNVESDSPYICRSEYTDLDMNGHVNNIKYASFALNAVSGELSAENQTVGFRIDFVKEVLSGESLRIHYQRADSSDGSFDLVCRGETDGAPISFGARFTVK